MIKNFRLKLVLWVLQLVGVLTALILSFQVGQYYLGSILIVVLLISLLALIRYVEKTNYDLAHFFSAIKYDDFTANLGLEEKGKSFARLHEGFQLINQKFLDIRAEQEAKNQFLQTLVQHVDIGLLCVNGQGEVILMNEALQNLLQKPYIVKLDKLKTLDDRLWELVRDLKPGQRELLKITLKNKLLHLSIQCVEIILQKEPHRLISFQNIQTELEEQELIAWQKLIRILTHEIMNSVAPISSLSGTIQTLMQGKDHLDTRDLEKLRKSIAVIERRSEGLLNFTETYRSLTRIPPPKFQDLDAAVLIEQVLTLMEVEFEKNHISLHKNIPAKELPFSGDPHLLEQVLINILKNAIEALEGISDPRIEIHTLIHPEGKIAIEINDNGPGISEDKLDQIFVPFFTTKENGSGIGLSLSRQIIRMHQGNLEIHSRPDRGTQVSIWI